MLFGYWPLNETETDADGPTAKDHTSNNNHGLVNGAGPDNTGLIGGPLGSDAYGFDGSDDYVTVPDNDALSPYSEISVSVWAKFDNYSDGSAETLARKNGEYILQKTSNSDVSFAVWDGGSLMDWQQTIIPSSALSNGDWFHIVGVFDGSTYKLYLDGVLIDSYNTGAQGIDDSTEDLGIGYSTSDVRYLDGGLSELRLYSRALTTSEIQYLYDVSQRGLHLASKKKS